MRTVLVTAFEPFGGSGRNSSLDTLRALPAVLADAEIRKCVLPVEYDRARELLAERVRETEELAALLCLGQAEGRGAITPEYIAVNVMNGAIPDNAGRLAVFEPIVPGGADGIFATLPVRRIAERLKELGIPSSVSFTAGTYVCNCVMYAALILAKPLGIPAGFIHLPLSEEIAAAEGKTGKTPALPQKVLTSGITEALRIILA